MILLAVGVLFAGVGISLLLREKGMSLNSDSLTPKPLASSVYVRVPEARYPHKRSISVMSLFHSRKKRVFAPNLILTIQERSKIFQERSKIFLSTEQVYQSRQPIARGKTRHSSLSV